MSRLLIASGPGFGRGQVVQNLSGVDIEPLLEAIDFLLGKAADITAFRNETANHPIQVLIAASFPRAVQVRVVDLGALLIALQTGAFQLRRAQKLAAVVHGDGPEGVPKPFGSEFPFDPIQRLHHAGLGLVVRGPIVPAALPLLVRAENQVLPADVEKQIGVQVAIDDRGTERHAVRFGFATDAMGDHVR